MLQLSDFGITEQDGKRRATARASLLDQPADPRQPQVHSTPVWRMQAPLGPIEADELRWYLEKYAVWPSSLFATQKQAVEHKLQMWGGLLYEQAFQQPASSTPAQPLASHATALVLAAWGKISGNANRRFSILSITCLTAAQAAKTTAAKGACVQTFLPCCMPVSTSRYKRGCNNWPPTRMMRTITLFKPCSPVCKPLWAAAGPPVWRRTKRWIMTMPQKSPCCWKTSPPRTDVSSATDETSAASVGALRTMA